MTNKAYLFAKIGGIAIILCMVFAYFWSTGAYALPSTFGVLTIASAVIFLYTILVASNRIAEIEEHKDRK